MKITIISVLILFATFCTPKNAVLVTNSSESLVTNSNCPKDGNCTIEILKNKKLLVKTDDIGGIYFDIINDNEYFVIKYTYNRKVEKDLQDASYSEEIIFEVKNDAKNWRFINQNMQNTKLLFGRHCYCKGQAGYFKINAGTITSKSIKDKIQYTVDFKAEKVPQILTKISFTIP